MLAKSCRFSSGQREASALLNHRVLVFHLIPRISLETGRRRKATMMLSRMAFCCAGKKFGFLFTLFRDLYFRVMNVISPGAVNKINMTGAGFKLMENIAK